MSWSASFAPPSWGYDGREAGSQRAKLSLSLHAGPAVPTEATAGPSGSLPLCRSGVGWRLEAAVGSEKTAGPGTGSHSSPSVLSFLAGGSLRMNFESNSFWVNWLKSRVLLIKKCTISFAIHSAFWVIVLHASFIFCVYLFAFICIFFIICIKSFIVRITMKHNPVYQISKPIE